MPKPATAPVDAPAIALHDSREIRGYGGVPRDRAFTTEELRHYRHGYYASISFLDAQLGEVLDALESAGHGDHTIVIFTSDHGFHIGEQGLWGKTSNFELDARVPLIVADPGHAAGHGRKSKSLAELVDLYPTLAMLTGTQRDLSKRLEGDNLAPVIADPTGSVKDAAFTQHQHPFYGARSNWKAWGYSVRTAHWRYTEWRSIGNGQIIARELYDHRNDPLETKNVVTRHAEIVAAHARRLAQQFAF